MDAQYPLWLTTGRIAAHYHTGTMTRNSPTLHTEMPEGSLEINPQDARDIGVKHKDFVKVSSRRGTVRMKVFLTESVPPGLVFMPFHFAENAANLLTNPAHDPVARIPEYKVCAVRVEKAV